jgi:hypothetical protein
MRPWRFTAALLCGLLAYSATVSADIAFPARLDVAEREPGIYDISFTLPIVEGRKLRAEPLMPPTCTEVGEREAGLSDGGLTTTWSVRCEPASLAGEAILVEGLLGTQTDLAFTLTMLDGRSYSRILRPSRPGFLVPDSASALGPAVSAAADGARRTLRHPGLWALLCVVALAGIRTREIFVAAAAFAAGEVAALWFASRVWLEVAPNTRDFVVWAAVIGPALALVGSDARLRERLRPLWPAALLLGLLFGGQRPEAAAGEGLSNAELILTHFASAIGAGAAVLLLAVMAWQLAAILEGLRGGKWREAGVRWIGTAAGGLAVGNLLALIVAFALRTGTAPRAPLEFVLLAAVLGAALVLAGWDDHRAVSAFVLLAVAGAVPGLLRYSLPGSGLLVLGPLIVLACALAFGRSLPPRWVQALAAVAIPAGAWNAAHALAENVSRAGAVTSGVILVSICVFWGALFAARSSRDGLVPVSFRLLGGIVAAAAVLWRLAEYGRWFNHEVATEAALGLARLPLLALVCAALAIVLWPRRRRVAQELGLERDRKSWHWVALGSALLVVPYGTVTVPNPFFEPHAPRGADASRVLTRVLSDTYHAFNIADEDELYDTLAANVTGDLVDDLYLDGRRRLTAGTREGTRVTVRDVSVVEVGEPFGGATAEEGFSYECSWAVVARVQHLQHIHHRRNLYNGVLILQSDRGRWKIAGVELVSEDRVVVPWNPT